MRLWAVWKRPLGREWGELRLTVPQRPLGQRLQAVKAASPPLAPHQQAGVLLHVPCPGLGAICLQRRSSWPENLGPDAWTLPACGNHQTDFPTFVHEKAVVCLRRKFFSPGEWSPLTGLSLGLGSSLDHVLPTRLFSLQPPVFSMPLSSFSLTIFCERNQRFWDFWSGAFYYTCNSSLP